MPVARLALVLFSLVIVANGCTSGPEPVRDEMFAPATIRIHPTFTQFKDWTGDGTPDGVEALVEVQDTFGEPTRVVGDVMFELHTYRPDMPEQRRAIGGPWRHMLTTRAEQEERWNRACAPTRSASTCRSRRTSGSSCSPPR